MTRTSIDDVSSHFTVMYFLNFYGYDYSDRIFLYIIIRSEGQIDLTD